MRLADLERQRKAQDAQRQAQAEQVRRDAEARRLAEERRLAAERRLRPYGPDTCIEGYVWREATPSDRVCVTPAAREQAVRDNGQKQFRVVR